MTEKFQGKKYETRLAKSSWESFSVQDAFRVDKMIDECFKNPNDSFRLEEDGKEYYYRETKTNDLHRADYTIFFYKQNDTMWILGIFNRSFRSFRKKSLKEIFTLYGYTWPPILE